MVVVFNVILPFFFFFFFNDICVNGLSAKGTVAGFGQQSYITAVAWV